MFFYMYENMAGFCFFWGVTSAGLLNLEGTEGKQQTHGQQTDRRQRKAHGQYPLCTQETGTRGLGGGSEAGNGARKAGARGRQQTPCG